MGIYKQKCHICNEEFRFIKKHILKDHNISILEYFQMLDNTNGKCKICNKETTFKNMKIGFFKRCSDHCDNSLKNYILVDGEELGKKKWEDANNKRKKSNSKKMLIEKFGKDKADKICKSFSLGAQIAVDKRKNNLSKMIDYNKKAPNRIEYWLNKGYSEEEAQKKLSERQSTFSLEKCIRENGKIKGKLIWKKRQEKWQSTLKSKSQEEINEINFKKIKNGLLAFPRGYSKVSQELFWSVYEKLEDKNVYFATNGVKNTNNEYIVKTENGIRLLDFYIPKQYICIEFDGVYWHRNKKLDLIRENEIYKSIPNIKIYHVKENDYYKDKVKVINECLNFIKENSDEKN